MHSSFKISAIVAMSKNRVIGNQNKLPWHLPADLKHFKQITTGHPILMGRKTYESIGKPLPNRSNIILTRDALFKAAGCQVEHTISSALAFAEHLPSNEIFIIGGETIYQQLMPFTQRIYMTIVDAIVEGDAFFPALPEEEWKEVARVDHPADESNPYAYSFLTLDKI